MDALGRYGGRRPGSASATATSAPTSTAPSGSRKGRRSSTVTAEIAAAWGLGAAPAAGHRRPAQTHGRHGSRRGRDRASRSTSSQRHHAVAVERCASTAPTRRGPAPGVLEALAEADRVVVAPSNPIVSIGPVLAVPGVRDAVRARRDDVVAVSPIVAGAALKGPADRLLRELGHEASVVGVARLYAPARRHARDRRGRRRLAAAVEAEGIRCVVAPTVMRDAGRRRLRSAEVVLGMTRSPRGLPGPGHPRGAAGRRPRRPDRDAAEPRAWPTATSSSSPRRSCRRPRARSSGSTPTTRWATRRSSSGSPCGSCAGAATSSSAETKHGFVCANAGVDLSNVDEGWAALLPDDPRPLGPPAPRRDPGPPRVSRWPSIVSDTFGRAWRRGLTDVAIGCAGIGAVVDLRGTTDTRGRELQVTEVCVVDELAGAAELVMGKATGVAAAVVRGVDPAWLGRGEVRRDRPTRRRGPVPLIRLRGRRRPRLRRRPERPQNKRTTSSIPGTGPSRAASRGGWPPGRGPPRCAGARRDEPALAVPDGRRLPPPTPGGIGR